MAVVLEVNCKDLDEKTKYKKQLTRIINKPDFSNKNLNLVDTSELSFNIVIDTDDNKDMKFSIGYKDIIGT